MLEVGNITFSITLSFQEIRRSCFCYARHVFDTFRHVRLSERRAPSPSLSLIRFDNRNCNMTRHCTIDIVVIRSFVTWFFLKWFFLRWFFLKWFICYVICIYYIFPSKTIYSLLFIHYYSIFQGLIYSLSFVRFFWRLQLQLLYIITF